MSRQQQDTLEQERWEQEQMDIKKLSEPLLISQIDFRVQSINNGGYATILAYKDARVDQQVLDDVVGPLGWKREHVNGNHNCIVSIWCDDKRQWVGKEDTGTESNTEAKKGLASDSFKRACFNWGIGRELYDYPQIQVKLRDNEYTKGQGQQKPKASWNLKPNDWIWFSEFTDGKLSFLGAKDSGGLRYKWGEVKNRKEKPISVEQVAYLHPFMTVESDEGERIVGAMILQEFGIEKIEDLPASKFDGLKKRLEVTG